MPRHGHFEARELDVVTCRRGADSRRLVVCAAMLSHHRENSGSEQCRHADFVAGVQLQNQRPVPAIHEVASNETCFYFKAKVLTFSGEVRLVRFRGQLSQSQGQGQAVDVV